MLVTVTSSNLLDVKEMDVLRIELTQHVRRACGEPSTAVEELAEIWTRWPTAASSCSGIADRCRASGTRDRRSCRRGRRSPPQGRDPFVATVVRGHRSLQA